MTKTPVLATLVTSFEFTGDGKQIAAVLVPDGRAPMPPAPASPTGPTVKLADTDKNRLRTFPSLMSTPYEKQLLEWHATGQLALIDVQKGAVKKVGEPAMIRSIDASPDGKYVRVTRMIKPFSYDVPVSSFGQIEEIWDADGKVLAKISERPINLGVQDDTQPPPDPRRRPAAAAAARTSRASASIAWRTDGQGLTYLEQEPAPPAGAGRARDGGGRAATGRAGGAGGRPARTRQGRGGARPSARIASISGCRRSTRRARR